jgi:phage tail tube protein FII
LPNPLFVMEFANMYCGSAPDDDGASNHLILTQVELPQLEVQYIDHRPGGAPVSVEIDVVQTRMECKFELVGITRQVMQLLYGHMPRAENFFIYGSIRDQLSGEAIQLEAQIRGQLGLVGPGPFQRGGEPMRVRYAIRGINAYVLSMADAPSGSEEGTRRQSMPIYEWDFFTNVWAVGGVNQNGISTGTPTSLLFNIPT